MTTTTFPLSENMSIKDSAFGTEIGIVGNVVAIVFVECEKCLYVAEF